MADNHTQGKMHTERGSEMHCQNNGRVGSIVATFWGAGAEANAERSTSILNAADGIPTEQAVKAIENYSEAVGILKIIADMIDAGDEIDTGEIDTILAKLEVK